VIVVLDAKRAMQGAQPIELRGILGGGVFERGGDAHADPASRLGFSDSH